MVLQGDKAQVEARFIPFGTVLILTQDGCTICVERSTCSKIILDALDGLLGDVGHVESRFSPFGYSVSVSAR
jgi:hypothetical protein